MDPDVFPNTIEYWGPTGMVFFRNVQVRWYAWSDEKSSLVLAAERPGASGDQGVYSDRVELDGIRARFPAPDFSGAWKFNGDWGYARVAGIVRSIKWDDTLDDGLEPRRDPRPAGPQFQFQPQVRDQRRPPAGTSSVKASRTT